jgi:hypothetical protein
MPKVLNKKTDEIPPDAVYVGRPSKWGNQFRIGEYFAGRTLSREDCIMLYRHFLESSPAGQALLQDIGELRGKDLVCWCAPLPCHAGVLLELANKEEANVRDEI